MLTTEQKNEVITKHKQNDQDTGSPQIQVALLTTRINLLAGHFKSHKKDHSSRRGLLKMVGRRRRLLNYLKKSDAKGYEGLVKELGLRK